MSEAKPEIKNETLDRQEEQLKKLRNAKWIDL